MKNQRTVLAILQSMWHHEAPTKAPLYFVINPRNRSGAKLYRITTGHRLYVTNSTSVCGTGPDSNAPIDMAFLERAIRRARERLKADTLLVCGRQAKEAFERLPPDLQALPHLIMPHPAARNLTNRLLADVTEALKENPLRNAEFIQQKDGHEKRYRP